MKSILFLFLTLLPIFSFSQVLLKTAKPWMGVFIGESKEGVLIKDTLKGTPARKSGLKTGDIVTSINGEKVLTPTQLINKVAAIGVGNIAKIKYLKDGKKESLVELELVARPEELDLVKKNLLNKKAPPIKTKILSQKSKEYDLNNSGEKITIIEFWATWCGACRQAHPIMSQFAKNNPNIDVIAISNEEPRDIKKYLHHLKEKDPLIKKIKFLKGSDTDIFKNYYVPVLPLFIAVDKKKIIKDISIGVGPKLIEFLNKAKKL